MLDLVLSGVHSASLEVSKCHFLNSSSPRQKAVIHHGIYDLLSRIITSIIFKERKLMQSVCE